MTDKHFIGSGQDAIRNFERTAKQAMENRVVAFKEKIQKILDEIRALDNEKYQVQRSPLTKGELLELAKAELEKKKNEFIPDLLRKHLESCQVRKDLVFSDAAVIAKLFPRNEFWKLFYYLVDEETLKSVVDSLPDAGGLSKTARVNKIREIDKKIEALKSQVDLEFAAAAT
ncbi:hypothetical protein [uncultured Desulfosarcina sp.]|uniref:hypothetical protein n=1 Tax=uncultured Desulfosarcina sp. TaxID=218289 RepID=UPI0029C78DAE|nr:hypothetical protein [uncultured Desulfosarcina sp.]